MNKHKTILEVVKNNLCHGCGTCAGLCPQKAISLFDNKDTGTYVPLLDKNKCILCGICYDACPGHSVNLADLTKKFLGHEYVKPLGYYTGCYIGYANDHDLRFKSSSGGLVTAILVYALQNGLIDGALVTRMKKSDPLKPEPFIARTKDEILEAMGSKYCPVPLNLGLAEILNNEGKFAVVGLPCHIHGFRKAESSNQRLQKKIALHIGIFCGRYKTFLGTEYILNRANISEQNITSICYRGSGWPGNMTIETKDRGKITIPYFKYNTSQFNSFISQRCLACPDQTAELADISFGDAWLPEILKNDNIGTSIVICRNKVAEALLEDIARKKNITLSPTSVDKAYKSQGNKARHAHTAIKIKRLTGGKYPLFDLELPPPTMYSWYSNILINILSHLACQRRLWWLLDFICSAIILAGKIRTISVKIRKAG